MEKLGGIGQGNLVLGAICHNASCIIFEYLEERGLAAIVKYLMSAKVTQCIVIVFVGDTDFYANWLNFEEKIQLAIDLCTRLHEAIGDKM